MSAIYDNWERLVAATLKKEQLWELFHAPPSRTPSILSEASDFSSSSQHHDQDSWWQEKPPKLVLLSDFCHAFDVNDVQMASAELIGNGTFGSTYSAVANNGMRIVVKRLKLGSVSELDFKRHMGIIGKVKHGNIAPLQAYYASSTERILLYDYYNDGSVYNLLHGENLAHVSWETRRAIMVGVAGAIAEIHKKNGGKLVHGNIKASNVFLCSEVYCRVSELGLANMIETTFMSSAPEVKSSKDVSQASDVYNFGVLVLELLTRKPSVQIPGGREVADLVKLVRSKSASKVIDPDLCHLFTARGSKMGEVLEMVIKCVAKSVKRRPKMSEVLKMLVDSFEMNPIGHFPVEETLVFFQDVFPRFSMKDVMEASYEILGQGNFRASYKTNFKTGNILVVKKLKDAVHSFETFRQQVNVYGRMKKHKNVENIIAYNYFARDEALLFYPYYGENSISALLLHGKRNVDRKVLNWKSRCNIAIDVARAIAHIHGEDGVHGNIKSSNIFLVDQNHCILSGAGISKLTTWNILTGRRHPGYIAPELMHTWQASQASDVHSFGAFLVELISGLSALSHHLDPGSNKVLPLIDLFRFGHVQYMPALVLDVEVLRYGKGEKDAGIIDFLQIATDCLDTDPLLRPKMPVIVKMLEEIRASIETTMESKREDAAEEVTYLSIETRLENLLLDVLLTTAP